MAGPYAYTTPAAIQAILFPDDATNQANFAAYTTLIGRASAAINAKCRRVFTASAGETRHFDAPGTDLLIVPDLQSVDSLSVGGAVLDASEYQLLAYEPPAYELVDPIYNSFTAIRRLTAGIPLSWRAFWAINVVTPFKAVAITGTWGFATAPLEVAEACEIVVCRLWARRLQKFANGGGLAGKTATPAPSPTLDDDVLTLLQPYLVRLPPRLINEDLPARW